MAEQKIKGKRTAAHSPDEVMKKQKVVTLPKGFLQASKEYLHKKSDTPVERARAAIAAKLNPMILARIISEAKTSQITGKDLAETLGVKAPWLSRKLALLSATETVQVMIENGELSEREYHTYRDNVVEYLIRRDQSPKLYQRTPQVSINIDAAKNLIEVLKIVLTKSDGAPITIHRLASKKVLSAVLNFRSAEVLSILTKNKTF